MLCDEEGTDGHGPTTGMPSDGVVAGHGDRRDLLGRGDDGSQPDQVLAHHQLGADGRGGVGHRRRQAGLGHRHGAEVEQPQGVGVGHVVFQGGQLLDEDPGAHVGLGEPRIDVGGRDDLARDDPGLADQHGHHVGGGHLGVGHGLGAAHEPVGLVHAPHDGEGLTVGVLDFDGGHLAGDERYGRPVHAGRDGDRRRQLEIRRAAAPSSGMPRKTNRNWDGTNMVLSTSAETSKALTSGSSGASMTRISHWVLVVLKLTARSPHDRVSASRRSGTISTVPGLTRMGSSMLLASARARHLLGSWYSW